MMSCFLITCMIERSTINDWGVVIYCTSNTSRCAYMILQSLELLLMHVRIGEKSFCFFDKIRNESLTHNSYTTKQIEVGLVFLLQSYTLTIYTFIYASSAYSHCTRRYNPNLCLKPNLFIYFSLYFFVIKDNSRTSTTNM